MTDDAIIPFGKYKGRKLDDVLAVDRPYLDWLIAQPWFREKNPNLVTIIINGGSIADADSPEHNRLQIKFLNPTLCNALWIAVFKEFRYDSEYKRYEKIAASRFETAGWDVVLQSDWSRDLCVELKPTIGDDFPAILRKINARRPRQWNPVAVVAETFNCQSAALNQIKEMYAASSVHLFQLQEILNIQK